MNRHLRPLLATLAIALAAGLTALLGGAASAQSANIDYDLDNDNLIEITTLEQLAAINYDLDGDGAVDDTDNTTAYAAAFPNHLVGMGCADDCTGYELAGSLDLKDDASYADAAANKTDWTTGAGWDPIGAFAAPFTGTFDGNGHTISNLYVNMTAAATRHAGLFGSIGGVVKNVGVTGEVTASLIVPNVLAPAVAGGLAGHSSGKITGSWADVRVEAKTSGPDGATISAYAGGLVGGTDDSSVILRSHALGDVTADAGGGDVSYAGGLVGVNNGRIGASFATGAVLADSNSGAGNALGGNAYAGGLVGDNIIGTVSASYATGSAEARSGSSSATQAAGGLAGRNSDTIEASYSRGTAAARGQGGTGQTSVGGLVGSGTATASYWDTQTSGIADDTDPAGKTTAELQTPTDYTGIYTNWNVDYDNEDGNNSHDTGKDDPWLFGTASDYPRLKELMPVLESVSVADSGTLGPGGKITVTVTFDWPVKASATSTLNIAVGGQARAATYASGSGGRSVTFAYAVKRGDNGAVTVPDGSIASGTITDLSGVNGPVSLAFTKASVPDGLNAVTVPFDTTKPSVRYKPPTSLTVGQRIRTIVPITSDTDIASYALKEGSVLPRTLRLDTETGYITGRPTRAIGRATTVTIIVCDAEPNCAEVTLKLPAIIDEEADAPPPEPQLPEVPPLDLSSVKVGDASPTGGLLLALASAGAALLAAGVGVAVRRRRGK